MYTAHLWRNYRLFSIRKLNVACNDMRLKLHLIGHHSARQLFADVNVPGFHAVIRTFMFNLITRLDKSENVIIRSLVKIGMCDQPCGGTGTSRCYISHPNACVASFHFIFYLIIAHYGPLYVNIA